MLTGKKKQINILLQYLRGQVCTMLIVMALACPMTCSLLALVPPMLMVCWTAAISMIWVLKKLMTWVRELFTMPLTEMHTVGEWWTVSIQKRMYWFENKILVESSSYKMHQPRNLSIDFEHHYFWHVITLPTTIHFLNQLLIKALLTKSLRKLHQNCTLPTNKNKFKKINKRNNSFVYLKALTNLWKQIFT